MRTAIYGTIGPACTDPMVLQKMFAAGMTGMRLNLSHVSLAGAAKEVAGIHAAAEACGKQAELLIDMQGPELRIGRLPEVLKLQTGGHVAFRALFSSAQTGSGEKPEQQEGDPSPGSGLLEIPVPELVLAALRPGQDLLLDDGKLLLRVEKTGPVTARVLRGGLLSSSKSIALPGIRLDIPAMTAADRENIRLAAACGVTAVMQPFVRSREDLLQVRQALDEAGGQKIRLLAKIENQDGVENLTTFFGTADEIVIARGDLGNAMPLWQLPVLQKKISAACRAAGVPFMVVTQMLASMEHAAVPTRAEVSDICNAVLDGAASVMVTGETAVGAYPVETIRYLAETVRAAEDYKRAEGSAV